MAWTRHLSPTARRRRARGVAIMPEAAGRLHVTQMAGALNYRHADKAEHNVRLDLEVCMSEMAAG